MTTAVNEPNCSFLPFIQTWPSMFCYKKSPPRCILLDTAVKSCPVFIHITKCLIRGILWFFYHYNLKIFPQGTPKNISFMMMGWTDNLKMIPLAATVTNTADCSTSLAFSSRLPINPWWNASTHLHDVEEDFLPQAVLPFEELVLGVGAGNVSADELLTGGWHLQQLRVLILHRHVGGIAQQLPDDGAEVMGDALPDQLLGDRETKTLKMDFYICFKCTERCKFEGLKLVGRADRWEKNFNEDLFTLVFLHHRLCRQSMYFCWIYFLSHIVLTPFCSVVSHPSSFPQGFLFFWQRTHRVGEDRQIQGKCSMWNSLSFFILGLRLPPLEVCPSCVSTPPTHWQCGPIESRYLPPSATGLRRPRSWTPARSRCCVSSHSLSASTWNQPPATCMKTVYEVCGKETSFSCMTNMLFTLWKVKGKLI